MVEILTGILFLAVFRRYGLSLTTLAGLILSGSLVAITFIDIDIWEIPDEISIPGIAIGCALRPWAMDVPWFSGIVGAALGAALLLIVRWTYFALRGPEAMGMGDVKLLAMIGAFLGAGGLLPVLLFAAFTGSVIGGILIFVAKQQATDESAPENEVDDPTPEPADDASLRLVWLIQRRARTTYLLGAAPPYIQRSHVRIGWVFGYRGPNGAGFRSLFGIVQQSPGWGNFEGVFVRLGRRRRLWMGPMLGEREPLVDDDAEWTPPPGAFPFGPFLALGALAELLFGPQLRQIFTQVTMLIYNYAIHPLVQ